MAISPSRSRSAARALSAATGSRARRAVAPVAGRDADATVGAATYRRVRADILYGRLAPGQKLPLERMRDTYGSAVGTLREVLNALASEGLVRAEGARGFEVEPVSTVDLGEIAALRLLLERDALRLSFAAGDVEWEARVVAAHHKLASIELQVTPGDRSGEEVFRRYDAEFHTALLSACGSRLLLDLHARIYDKYLRYLVLASVFRGTPVADEHRALMQCALARDWQRAQALTTTHVQACVEQMLAGDWWTRPAARAAA